MKLKTNKNKDLWQKYLPHLEIRSYFLSAGRGSGANRGANESRGGLRL